MAHHLLAKVQSNNRSFYTTVTRHTTTCGDLIVYKNDACVCLCLRHSVSSNNTYRDRRHRSNDRFLECVVISIRRADEQSVTWRL